MPGAVSMQSGFSSLPTGQLQFFFNPPNEQVVSNPPDFEQAGSNLIDPIFVTAHSDAGFVVFLHAGHAPIFAALSYSTTLTVAARFVQTRVGIRTT